MTISGNGGHRVAAPACRPPRYGLGSVADVRQEAESSWAVGLEWDELECGYDPGVVGGECPELPEHLKSASRGFSTAYADAFLVYAGWECSTGGLTLSEAWDNAEQLLERNWWRSLESAFWTGRDQDGGAIRSTLGMGGTGDLDEESPGEGSPGFPTDLTPGGGALDITSGVAALESFAADCFDCEPIVHANRGLATYVANHGLLAPGGDALRLAGTGTLFVPGGGYATSGPGGAAAPADEAWMFVSGSVSVVHGPTFYTPDRGDEAGAVDRLINDVTVYAERMAAFQTGCCVGAVRVTLDPCC
jgi:hypothetical protein